MDLGISGRRAAVAAGTAGLGFATAAALAAEGVQVAVCGRDERRLADAVAELGPGAVGVRADVAAEGGAHAFIEEAAALLDGPIDILIANAGGPPPASALTEDADGYRRAFELSCLATIELCRAAVPGMAERGWGRVVAITSIGARQPIAYLAASSVARAGVTSYLKLLAREVAPRGVTVNSLQPGSHDTERIRSLSGGRLDETAAAIPVGRLGDPDGFGRMAAMLCSVHAGFVTGAALPVDGGAAVGLP